MGIEQKIYTIANAHLDTSWVWTFETTIKNFIPDTFNENFDLFEKYPEYKFNFEGSYRYELMKEYYPKAFEKVKEYVKKGQWSPCGSCYENGDVNIPSPEALIRNIIYGNGFFKDNFGVMSNDIFLPDCFGFGKALPEVAAHCGLTGFSTQKLTWGCSVPIPFDVGRWIGLDGKGIWCAIKPMNYTTVFDKVRTHSTILAKLKENAEKYGFNSTFEYHGVGDQGGSPEESSVKTVVSELRQNSKNAIKVLSATTREFFDDLEKMTDEQKKRMPVYKGEFLMTEHGAGSYTSRTVSKRWNRRSELLGDAAERTAVSSFLLGLSEYPINVLDTAWKSTIAHQFHDDITGTSWMIDYKRNWNDYVRSMNLFSTEYTNAVRALTGAMDTSFASGIPVAVSNTVQAKGSIKQAVSVDIRSEMLPLFTRVYDSKGKEVPSQIKESTKSGFKTVTFIAEVPSNGISVFDVKPSDKPYKGNTGLTVTDNKIENKRYIVIINGDGDISAVYDKILEKDLLSAPVRMEFISDLSIYHYSAWEVKYKDIMRKPFSYAGNAKLRIVDDGPALAAIEIIRSSGNTNIKQVISLDAESDFVKVFNEVDWRHESANLKVSFPVSASAEKSNYDIGVGTFGRAINTRSQFEVPAQRWVDTTDSNGDFGVSILSDSRVGWDKPSSNTVRMTAVHTATNANQWRSSQHVADLGLNRFSFGITGHKGEPDVVSDVADRFCQPMHTFICDSHKGNLDPVFSICSVNSNTVRILGLKRAQKSNKVVIRLCEYTGNPQKKVRVKFALPILKIEEITGDERKLSDIEVVDDELVVDFNAHELRSFALTFNVKRYRRNYGSIDLPYDFKFSSYNDDEKKSLLPNGYSVPAELIPDKITVGGVGYSIGKDGSNALCCKGQVIDVPKGAKSVHFLLTSLVGDKVVSFKADDKEIVATVQDCFEAVGAWDLIGLGETGYIKNEPQYFTFTHTHSAAGDEIAKQFYLFHAVVPCENCSQITFPDDSNIIVVAASYSNIGTKAIPADEHFDSLEKRAFDYKISHYAQSRLSESKFCVVMDKISNKVKGLPENSVITEKRKKRVADGIRNCKDFCVAASEYIRTAEVVASRKIDNLRNK